ncbi:MAG: sodium:solute symporter [Planctomycetota bacterium]|nr:sodium:solute symporter [Planctomycetota bacterium]
MPFSFLATLSPTPATPPAGGFAVLDWAILGAYLVVVLVIGAIVSRRKEQGNDFFLAGRSMPTWAVAISVLATALSAATFVGGPQLGYLGRTSYLLTNIGGLLAVCIVGFWFIPAFYRTGVTSVYELVGHRFGGRAQRAASGMFMLGRLLASGARLFIVAIPFSLVAFNDVSVASLSISIMLITVVAAAYTMAGGIRAVIWTDVLQAVVVVGTVGLVLVVLLDRIDTSTISLADQLGLVLQQEQGEDIPWISRSYTLLTAFAGFTLFSLAAFGTDQDLAQRLLTCRDARGGTTAVILSQVISWPVVGLFLLVGMLLFVYEQQHGPIVHDVADAQGQKVFLLFILTELPVGLRGLLMAGLFAAAMSSLDSVLNALASTTVADFLRRRRGIEQSPAEETRLTRWIILAWALLLSGFALGCVFWQSSLDIPLIDFALGVMVFAYSGLLGVFLCAIFTRRGNAISAIAALLAGFVLVLLMEPAVWKAWTGLEWVIAFPWRMTFASVITFVVCLAGPPIRASAIEGD